ncbi:hypothetical protein PENCOP_c007G04238 [Penicillium coprophilum]|uniref:Alcohol dehydrogenase-like C-terminal domain-containing protein n=1 Tax=Penicillium coprophilum TaxID=36646 RepID=A0A1V6ULJ2_9EURO|nr:hypothetical protein PENCOP_c007G04238 [Penicillium coprophilum]
MHALQYSEPKKHSIVEVPVPELRENDVLIKVKACGVCGTYISLGFQATLAQMLRQNGGCNVVVVAPGGLKMDLAQELGAGDNYIDLSRESPQAQFDAPKAENSYGFDIFVEATGSQKILEASINYVRRGGKLVMYGVYSSEVRVSWSPAKIFVDEITIVGIFSEMYKFPAAVDYLDSGKVKVDGIANKVYKIEQWEECLEAMRNKTAIKAAIVFD